MRSVFVKIGFNILGMLLLTVLGTLCFMHKEWLLLSLIFIALASLFRLTFIIYNRANSKLAYLLDAVKNNDTSLIFRENIGSNEERELHRSLNRLNEMLHKARKSGEVREHYFRAIINQSSTGLIVRKSEVSIALANESMLSMCKLPTLYHIEQLDRVSTRFKSIISTIKPGEEVLESISIYGVKQHLSIQATELINQKESHILISVRDLQTELDQNELDSWIKLIRVLTHEIMNSLAPISSVSQTLTEVYKEGSFDENSIDESTISLTRKGIELIHEQSAGLISFVNSYRSLTRIPEPDFERVDINELIVKWREIALEIAPESIEILSETDLQCYSKREPEPIWILTDVQMLNRVISNLLKNGVEAIGDREGCYLKIRFSDSNKIEIINSGPQISDEVMENIWIPFFTTKEHGSGIGLSLCKQIIKRLNGDITVMTSAEKTSFIINLTR